MAVTMKTEVKLRVAAQGTSHSRTDIRVRDLSFAIDEPTERGGTNTGPTPTDTVLAALAGCTNVIGNKCAAKLGIDIGHLNVDIVCQFDRRGVTLEEEIDVPFTRLTQTVTADGPATDEELQKVAAETEKFCPLAKLFQGAGTEVITTWQRA
ncbi:MAG: OsmC family protein [Pseudomonadota bacterium]